MELTQLRYFVAAARALHFGRAAEQVGISQPSLSQQIARLELDLGALLFARRGRRVELTDAGTALLPAAERLLIQAGEARALVRQVAGLEQGRLSIAALPALDQHLLPPWLAAYRRRFPGVELRVRELRPTRAVAQAVMDGQADLGFLQLPCPAADAGGLRMRPLLTEPLLLVAPADHRLSHRAHVVLADARDEDWVWVTEAQEPSHPLWAACLAAGFAPRVVCESGSVQGVLALVAAGLGVTLLPRLAVEERPGIRALTLAPPEPTRTLAVVWRAGALSHAARAFVGIMDRGSGEGAEPADHRRASPP